MSDHRHRAARELVDAALELPASSRAAFLEQASVDADVRADASRWLAACEHAELATDFLAQAAAERAAPLLDAERLPSGALDAPGSATEAIALATLRVALASTFAVEREIGRGGMAAVYLARDLRHRRRVAVKVLHPELAAALGAERFLREIEVTAELQHPHILPLFDSGAVDGRLYYVMPYVEGETLRERLAREPRLPVDDAVRLVREMASALDYAHRKGVVHRDIKPANVLLADGHAIIADFGIARAMRRALEPSDHSDDRGNASGASGALTDAGTSPGTPGYMAPEQASGKTTVDHRADLYALGVVAYEALAGAHPFGARGPGSPTGALPEASVPPLVGRRPDVPRALATLVMRLLERDPSARPQSAAEVVAELDALRPPAEPVGSASSGAPERARSTRLGHMRKLVAVLAAGVAVALGARAVRRDAPRAPGTVNGTTATAGVAPSLSAIHTLAVLPFTSAAAPDDYFSDGLTDELSHALARLPGLRVSARTSSNAFKGRAVPVQEIGRALGVGALVAGTVRRAGDRLRISAQLVSAVDGTVLWDSVFESRSRDVFVLQDEFTRAIVVAIAPALSGTAGGAPTADASRGTADPEAYDLYLKGRYYWGLRGAENVARSISYFRQAIARDPRFARAHAGLAMAYSVLPNYVPDVSDSAIALTRAAALRAVALDSTLADGQLALGIAFDDRLQFRDALARYRAAVSADPASVTGHHWLGMSLLNLGRTEEALVELRHATDLDPLAPTPASAFALALVYARRFPEARDAAHRALGLDSTFTYALWSLGIAEAFGGRPDSAIHTFELAARLHPSDSRMSSGLVLAYAAAGRWADASRVRAKLHRPAVDRSGWADAAVADMVFGDPMPLANVMSSPEGQRRYVASGGLFGCNPLLDPLWSHVPFSAAMGVLGVSPCRLARPLPLARRPGA